MSESVKILTKRDGLRVLVTGGAGYVGSHIVRHLRDAGHEPVVFDNLYSGHRWATGDVEFVNGDLGNRAQLEALLSSKAFDAVVHCAAHIWVGESVRKPAKYYYNNTSNAVRMFDLCAQYGIENVVLSSTAAVYGEPDVDMIDEDTELKPINPYGASKMFSERALEDIAAAAGLRYGILRYFNVAGAHHDGSIGEATPENSHLVKIACETALGKRPGMFINGIDYPTPDGTCIRDYVHIDDLASAHLSLLEYLADGSQSTILNCGYGHGYSVREVLETVARVTGRDLNINEGPRRDGDPARLVADARRIVTTLDWKPQHDDLDYIVSTAWRFEQKLAKLIEDSAAMAS
jgi:UDP-glucose 4-epimerase